MRRALLGVLLLLAGCGGQSPVPAPEPEHQVNFAVGAVGSANDDVEISWSAGGGASGTTTVPGSVPVWAKTVTSERNTTDLLLSASGWSTDTRFSMTCSITVDGIEVAQGRGSTCSATFSLRNLASARAHPPYPSSAPPSPVPAQARPAGCRFLTDTQVAAVVQQATGVDKPVQVSGGSENFCTYVIDYQTARVRVGWEPRGRAKPTAATEKIRGLPEPAYWLDLGTFGSLQVQRRTGLLTVTVEPGALTMDRQQVAIDVYRAARPRLP